MSGVYISGIEKPKSCLFCELRSDGGPDFSYCIINKKMLKNLASISQSCPLIEVPDHGRLIDADELFKEFERKGWYDNADRDKAEDVLLDATTIIPAEDGEQWSLQML